MLVPGIPFKCTIFWGSGKIFEIIRRVQRHSVQKSTTGNKKFYAQITSEMNGHLKNFVSVNL